MAKKGTLSPGDPGYWEWRKQTGFRGRPKAIPTPRKMWDLACEYFQMVDETPYKKQDFIKGGESAGSIVELNNIRPYTWQGFGDYLHSQGMLTRINDYKLNRDGRYSEFTEVISAIDDIMFSQKFSGAAVGAFNANIISRDLGLVDKSQMHVTEEQPLFGDEPDDEKTD